jgi:hypothetical protein
LSVVTVSWAVGTVQRPSYVLKVDESSPTRCATSLRTQLWPGAFDLHAAGQRRQSRAGQGLGLGEPGIARVAKIEGKRHRGQNADDQDDDEQLDQREPSLSTSSAGTHHNPPHTGNEGHCS